MSGKITKEIIRCELESYVATEMEGSSPGARQVSAIQKMISLPEKSFDDLIQDIVNEIHRRNNMPHLVPETPMQRKLCRIREDGFKNLVLDLLLAMSQRSPEEMCFSSDVNGLIGDLDKLISSLKEDIANEEKMADEVRSECNFMRKTMMFAEYVRYVFNRNGEDTRLVEHVIDQLKRCSEDEIANGFDLLFNIDVFMKKCDESKHCDLPEYKYHRDNIRRLEMDELDDKTRRVLMRYEVSQIYSVISIENTRLKNTSESLLESKVHGLIEILCRIKDRISEGRQDDTYGHSEDLVYAMKDILGLIETLGSDSQTYADQLRSKISLLEQADGQKSNSNRLSAIFSMVEIVRKVLVETSRDRP